MIFCQHFFTVNNITPSPPTHLVTLPHCQSLTSIVKYFYVKHLHARKSFYQCQKTVFVSQPNLRNDYARRNYRPHRPSRHNHYKADAAAVIAEFEHQITYALKDGYAVKLFCGTIKPGASGTAENSDETFRPKPPLDERTPKRDHKIKLLFEESKAFVKQLTSSIKYKRSKSTAFCSPFVLSARVPYSKTPNQFFIDDFIQLHGNFLKFDASDTAQGVFFVNTSTQKEIRAQKYSRITRLNVTAVIPATLTDGNYTVQVRTLISGKLHHSNSTTINILGNTA